MNKKNALKLNFFLQYKHMLHKYFPFLYITFTRVLKLFWEFSCVDLSENNDPWKELSGIEDFHFHCANVNMHNLMTEYWKNLLNDIFRSLGDRVQQFLWILLKPHLLALELCLMTFHGPFASKSLAADVTFKWFFSYK